MARIAFMLPRLSLYGGLEQFAYRLAEAVAERHDIEFICSRAETPPPLGVRAIVVGRPFGVKALKIFWYLFRAEIARRKGKYDLSLGFGETWSQDILRVGGGPQKVYWKFSEKAWPQGFPRLSKRLRRYISPENWLIRFIDNRQLRMTKKIICVSDLLKQWTVEAYPNARVADVIYNLPDLKRYAPTTGEQRSFARAAYNINLGQKVIGTAASNFALKGVPLLIRALLYLPNDYILLVAGGRNPGGYKRLAKVLGLQDRVFFMGKIEDMSSFYRALDVFALPTYYDACSNAVLEARACGLRVLSSACNGSSVFLPKNWIVRNLEDPESFAEQVARVLNEPDPASFTSPKNIRAGFEPWLDLIEETLQEKAK